MDSKNDDSSISSDSLDKSLQQKCQVDDLEKEPVKSESSIENATTTSNSQTMEKADDELDASQQPLHKTENYSISDGINAAATEARVSSLRFFKPSSTISGTFSRVLDSDDDSDDGDSYANSHNKIIIESSIQLTPETKSTSTIRSSIQQKSTKHFETKVSQISENLKETKLETTTQLSLLGTTTSPSQLQIDAAATSSQSMLVGKSASSTIQNEHLSEELAGPSTSTTKEAYSDNAKVHVEHESYSSQTQTDSIDDPMDNRAKKVRFHPDAKENDGGNRVVPKRKKKMKPSTATATPSTIPQCEEQDEEEEIEIDLDEIAAMAEKYIEEHPLTFVPSTPEFRHLPPFTNPLPFGLMVEDDEEETLEDTTEKIETYEVERNEKESHKLWPTPDHEMHEIVIEAENGVECILGKKTVKNKESYLIRLVGSADLLWESTEHVQKKCPNLLNTYEEYLLLQEERLLEYLSERQNYRQRYTDF